MCKYCEFKKMKTSFSNDKIERGCFFTGDCDIEAFIIEEEYKDGSKDYSM